MDLDRAAARSVLGRIGRGIGGQSFLRASVFMYQFAVVPIYIAAWGLGVYGQWLTITAIAAFISFGDFGLTTAASVEVMRAAGTGDHRRAQDVFGSSMAMIALVMLPIFVCLTGAFLILSVSIRPGTASMPPTTSTAIFVATELQFLINLARGMYATAIVATGRYGLTNLISGTVRMVELMMVAIGVAVLHGPPLLVAGILTTTALLDLGAHIWCSRRLAPWATCKRFTLDLSLARRLAAPSLGNALLNIGVNGLTVQGPRLILSAMLGPASVAIYSVFVTAIRTIDTINGMMAAVMQAEFARRAASDGRQKTWQLVLAGGRLSFFGYLLMSAGILLAGPGLFGLWTHGTIPFRYALALPLLVGTLFTQIAKLPMSYLMGMNAVLSPAIGVLIGTAVGLSIGGSLLMLLGLPGMATGYAIGEAIGMVVVLRTVGRDFGRSAAILARSQMNVAPLLRQAGAIIRLRTA
jgi:O-antigen/teichoic acid export membrane protein